MVFKNLLASITILFHPPRIARLGVRISAISPCLLLRREHSVRNPDVDDVFMRAHPDYLLCLQTIPRYGPVAFFAALAALLTSLAMLVELLLWGKRSEVLKLWLQRFALGSAVFALAGADSRRRVADFDAALFDAESARHP